MYAGRTIFAQILDHLPAKHFEYLCDKYQSNRWVQGFTAHSHLICMVYAQLTRRDGLRDLVACLNSQGSKLYHLGVRQRVSRSTLADANEKRNYQLFEALGKRLIAQALDTYRDHDIGLGLREPLYAMDSTVIELCLSLFPWAKFRRSSAAIKAHTVIDLRGNIPVLVSITEGKVADVNLLTQLELPAGSIVVLDRGYWSFAALYKLVRKRMHFVIRARNDLSYVVLSSQAALSKDRFSGVQSDQIIRLRSEHSKQRYPRRLRRVRFVDEQSGLELVFLSNRLDLPAATIAAIYKQRWQVELFFKWLKQNLCVSHFFGNSINAVKLQIWVAICVYLLVLIAHKKLQVKLPMHTFMHLLEVNLFEKIPIEQMLKQASEPDQLPPDDPQHRLF